MRFEPHVYQSRVIEHIIDHPFSGIFLDMGLGKTVSTLTALNDLMYDHGRLGPGRILVIAPKKVARSVWKAEAAKWDHLKHLKVSRILGDRKARLRAMHTQAHIYVTSRDFVDWMVKELGAKWPYRCVVIDELSSFKNPQSVRFRQLRKVRPLMTRVIGLTGTPAPNGLPDLWAPMCLLDRGERLGKTLTSFRETYLRPLQTDGGYVVYKWGLRPGAEEAILSRISDICISMKADEWLSLPDLVPVDEPVELEPEAATLMKRLERELFLEVGGVDALSAESAAALNGKLTQMSGGAVYASTEPGDARKVIHLHDDKLDALSELTEALEASGENALVVYWYKHMKTRILDRFPQARELKTEQDEADWNAGKIPLLLIHPASAGHGLNLQDGGNVTIWVELPNWDLELYQQVNKRLHRQGQTRPVRIIHLIAKGTIDEDQLRALRQKDVAQDRVMEAVKARLKEAA